MRKNDMTIKFGGEAGMGVESSGAGFSKAMSRGGLHVFGTSDYMSRIRGGHNFFQIRVKDSPIYTHITPVDLLIPFTMEAVNQHVGEIVPGGAILYDEGLAIDEKAMAERRIKTFKAPLFTLANTIGGHRIMMNTAAIGAITGLIKYDLAKVESVIEDNFKRKGAEVVKKNLEVARAAYKWALDNGAAKFDYEVKPVPAPARMVLHGNQAISLGAMAAGLKFISAYPMTPATSVIEYINTKAAKYGIVTKQTEDEISAILMAIGAAHVGVRAMTATSGGGFCLMVEALGLAGMTETPLVLVEAQRAGPSTGLPTRTEQADLEFVLHASHGEFPRIVLTPGTIEQCFDAGARAFNLAEKYQCPVIIMTDLFLTSAVRSIDKDKFDFNVKIDRGQIMTPEQLESLEERYKRHAFTPTGISPRAFPGHPKGVYMTTSDEHDQLGHPIEDAETRIKIFQKRMKKLELAAQEMRGPELYGPDRADVTLVCWGSSYGAVRETVERLNRSGLSVNMLHFSDVWPFPTERAAELLDQAKYLVCVEGNFTGQLANLIRQQTGKVMDQKILKYDGRPFSPEDIIGQLRLEVKVS